MRASLSAITTASSRLVTRTFRWMAPRWSRSARAQSRRYGPRPARGVPGDPIQWSQPTSTSDGSRERTNIIGARRDVARVTSGQYYHGESMPARQCPRRRHAHRPSPPRERLQIEQPRQARCISTLTPCRRCRSRRASIASRGATLIGGRAGDSGGARKRSLRRVSQTVRPAQTVRFPFRYGEALPGSRRANAREPQVLELAIRAATNHPVCCPAPVLQPLASACSPGSRPILVHLPASGAGATPARTLKTKTGCGSSRGHAASSACAPEKQPGPVPVEVANGLRRRLEKFFHAFARPLGLPPFTRTGHVENTRVSLHHG